MHVCTYGKGNCIKQDTNPLNKSNGALEQCEKFRSGESFGKPQSKICTKAFSQSFHLSYSFGVHSMFALWSYTLAVKLIALLESIDLFSKN